MSRQTQIDPDLLLQHAGFIRALARGVLLHPDAADDIVQETLMAALRRPPQDQTKLRAWLGAVGRKIALKRRRSDGRRPRREKEAARRESLASTADIAAQLELQRQVVANVMELDEPYRSTIVHRYFHDRTPTEIAQALDVSVKTVESRLTRALKQLRGRLDQAHGRRAWSVALLSLALPRTEAAAATTVSARSAKVVVAALVVGVVLTVWSVVSADRSGREEQVRSAAHGPGFAANDPPGRRSKVARARNAHATAMGACVRATRHRMTCAVERRKRPKP